MPRRCTVCDHKQTRDINKALCNNSSYRRIASQKGLSEAAVRRHIEKCLSLDLAVIKQGSRTRQAIDVHAEFEEQLAFAKRLRSAAEEYLAGAVDPLRLVLIPRADEIDITYFDFGDTTPKGDPKKKTASLHALLAKVEGGLNLEADKVNIKHVDMRKFALDAISTTDTCIDKFAKLSGAYQKDRPNELTDQQVANRVFKRLMEELGLSVEAAVAQVAQMYPTADVKELGAIG